MVELATTIWADGPASMPYEPQKSQIRDWGVWVEAGTTKYAPTPGNVASNSRTFDVDSGSSLYNTAFGDKALQSLTGGSENVAIGESALSSLLGASGTDNGNGNTAVGRNALAAVIHKDFNTGIGSNAGRSITTGTGNVAVGHGSMGMDDYAPAFCTSSYNTFVGGWAGQELTTGGGNTGIGMNALRDITTGENNVGIGLGALTGSTNAEASAAGNDASNNVAIGYIALQQNKADSNIAIGFFSMKANITGNQNVAIGDQSLQANVAGSENVAIGAGALFRATAGLNTAVGRNAGTNLTTGTRNVFLGAYTGGSFQTGSNNTFVGVEANSFGDYTNSAAFGYQASVTGNNQVQLGNSATTTYVYGTVQNRSDERDKADIRDTVLGLDFIMKLRPVDYKWDIREDYIEVDEETGEVTRHERNGSKKRTRFHHGFIAQEVQASGFDFGGLQDHKREGGDDVLSIGYDEIIAPLVKAIHELKAANDDLVARVAKLEAA
ncbi:tail fiber domain-containing protein [Rhizobium sp.]|uniref:tail fiber domain-containing protein n=1 Tax=Rhizobium sp. TaxID=391 RepID=UPI0028A236AE